VEKLDQYVKIAEAAGFFGISQNTLRAWATEGKIPVRVNPAKNYRLFGREDLEQVPAGGGAVVAAAQEASMGQGRRPIE